MSYQKRPGTGNKKAHLNQMSFQYREKNEACYLTYLPQHCWDGFGTFSPFTERGCQGFNGPLPSAFLDKMNKELMQI
jgi:hypothetical protein